MTKAHRDFVFRQWGLDPDELAEVWGVRGVGPVGGRHAWSLYIPVHDVSGTVVSWTTRTIGSGPVRYAAADRESEAVSHKSLLYGEHLAGHAVVVGEGCPDAWAVGPGGGALFGVGVRELGPQVMRAARFPVRVVVMDANSPESVAKGGRLADELMVHPGETYRVVLQTGKDPSRCNKKELRQLRSFLK